MIGRFAPSPSGALHLGNLRTALVAWLLARQAGSRFLLRVEDLDASATRPGAEDEQLRDLRVLGLDWDGPVLHQSLRFEQYGDAIDDLDGRGLLYDCYCSRREVREAARAPNGPLPEGFYPGTCLHLSPARRAELEAKGRRPALRLRTHGASGAFSDRLAGEVEGPTDDFVIRRNDGTPAYNLAVIVDDAEQGVEEVTRGDDLLPSTPRQVVLAGLLGLDVPAYAHIPLALGPTGDRLQKRDGAVSLADRAARGEDADAVRSRLAASLGLAAPGESVTVSELLDRFDPEGIPREPWRLEAADL